MRTFGNILWLILGGLIGSIVAFLEGIILCITIIFIPVGLQMFKVSKFLIWPMGKQVVKVNVTGFKTFINIVWLILGGWENFLGYGLVGVIFCITIIGIPFGKQYFKLAKFTAMPLGHDFALVEVKK